jgi:hypothetical protein
MHQLKKPQVELHQAVALQAQMAAVGGSHLRLMAQEQRQVAARCR